MHRQIMFQDFFLLNQIWIVQNYDKYRRNISKDPDEQAFHFKHEFFEERESTALSSPLKKLFSFLFFEKIRVKNGGFFFENSCIHENNTLFQKFERAMSS